MSRSYREDCNAAKAARQGVVEQRPTAPKTKKTPKDTPFVVFWRWTEESLESWASPSMRAWQREWAKYGAYKSREVAEKVSADIHRKHKSYETEIRERS